MTGVGYGLRAFALLAALTPFTVLAQDDDPSRDVAEDDAQAPAADEPGTRAIALHAGLGLGFGTVSFERPTAAGAQVLNQTPFPAVEVLVRVRAWPGESFALETLLAYQSSLGLRLQLPALFGLPPTVSARVQRGELSVAPVLRLADDGSLAIALPIGFGFQSLLSEVHQFGMPQYIVGGPQLRPELQFELGEIFQLRIGPELQWILVLASSLRDEDACCQGVAFGAQASIEASLGAHLALALAYRQLTSTVTGPGVSFEDVQRFVTARIAGGF